MKLSIVSTMYQSNPFVKEFCRKVANLVPKEFDHYEIILVNDGCPTNSLKEALEARDENKNVKVVDLLNNVGHHKAMMVGMANTSGDVVYLTDVDMEDDLNALTAFWAEMQKQPELDVVFGIKRGAKKNFLNRVFNKMFNLFSEVKLPDNLLVSRLMRREYVQHLVTFAESELYIPGIWEISSNKQKGIEIEKNNRQETSYTFVKRAKMAINAITSFSNVPLYFIFYLGTLCSLSGFVYIAYLVLRALIFKDTLVGWVSVVASIYLMGGLMLLAIGIVGIYLSKVFYEVKRRPYHIVRKIYE